MPDLVAYKLVEVAFGEAISNAVSRIMNLHLSGARQILLDEFRVANITEEQVAERDEVLGMMIGYATAARQHAAFRNLRLLAQVLAHKTVHAEARRDDFIMWADMIGGLLPEEVIALATIQRHSESAEAKTDRPSQQHRIVRQAVISDLVGINRLCSDNEQFQAIGGALLRTGCLVPVIEDGSGMSFYPSFRMKELARMARLNEAAAEALGDLGLSP